MKICIKSRSATKRRKTKIEPSFDDTRIKKIGDTEKNRKC